jgi:hypothetical protein
MKLMCLFVKMLILSIPLFMIGALPTPSSAADTGSAAEARAMLEKAVVALKANKAEALAMFQKGEGGFKDRDLVVTCIGPDGTLSAHPVVKGSHVRYLLAADGTLPYQEMLKVAQEGKTDEIGFPIVRPHTTTPVRRVAYFTKVGDQVCNVGYHP